MLSLGVVRGTQFQTLYGRGRRSEQEHVDEEHKQHQEHKGEDEEDRRSEKFEDKEHEVI